MRLLAPADARQETAWRGSGAAPGTTAPDRRSDTRGAAPQFRAAPRAGEANPYSGVVTFSNRTRRRLFAVTAIVAVTVGLAACTPDDGSGQTGSTKPPASAAPTTSATPGASATPDAVAFNPEGTAAENLPAFTKVVETVWAGPNKTQGRAYIDALVAAGFKDKTKMQVTADYMGIGEPAESIIFAVNWMGECLIGQVGPETGAPATMLAPLLGSGLCLPGGTIPIDW